MYIRGSLNFYFSSSAKLRQDQCSSHHMHTTAKYTGKTNKNNGNLGSFSIHCGSHTLGTEPDGVPYTSLNMTTYLHRHTKRTHPAGDEEPRAVRRSVVRQPDLDAIAWEFVRVCSSNDHVSLDPSVRYLTDDVLVGKADDQPVLGGIVLVLVLDAKALPRIVVGLAFTAPPELHLVALEVSLVLDHFDESRLQENESGWLGQMNLNTS